LDWRLSVKTPRPWYRSQTDTWYVCKSGKQIPLSKGKDNKAEALRAFYRLMAREENAARLPPPSSFLVAEICDLFLSWSEKHNERATFEWYKGYLQSFCEECGKLRAIELKPFHVTEWLDDNGGWQGSRRCAISAIKRVFNWAVSEGILSSSPIKQVMKPPVRSRERILSPVEREEIAHAIRDQEFRDFVFAMQETGCRPSEVARVSSENVDLDLGLWVFSDHKTVKKTGKPRIIYLTPAMVELTKRLVAKHPVGPLFRGPRHEKPFTRNSIRCRFRRLREKLPHLKGVISYTYRHSFTTDALENGVGVVEVAELLGHRTTEMVMRHYQHLSAKTNHLKRAAVQATRQNPSIECA
jgi:integrase